MVSTPSTRMPDPHSIYQGWLDTTSTALMEGDVTAFTAAVAIPFIFRTSGGETVLETPEDIQSDTASFIQALNGQQVTNYIRLVKKARYLNEETIEGWHTTYMLHNATAVTPPYGNRMILRLIDGAWKVTEADHELSGDRFPVTVLRSDPGSFEQVWRNAKAGISATQARAEPIYQVCVDAISDALTPPNFDAWCANFTFPHEIHYDTTDHVAPTPEDVRMFFDVLIGQMKELDATRMIRSTRYAEFLSDDRILGYHDTIIVKDDKTLFGPVKSRMVLTNSDGRWKCSSVTNSLSQDNPSDAEHKVSVKLPTMREIQERMRK